MQDANPVPVAAEREAGLELLGFVVEFALLRQGAADVFHQVALLGALLHEGFERWDGGRRGWGGGGACGVSAAGNVFRGVVVGVVVGGALGGFVGAGGSVWLSVDDLEVGVLFRCFLHLHLRFAFAEELAEEVVVFLFETGVAVAAPSVEDLLALGVARQLSSSVFVYARVALVVEIVILVRIGSGGGVFVVSDNHGILLAHIPDKLVILGEEERRVDLFARSPDVEELRAVVEGDGRASMLLGRRCLGLVGGCTFHVGRWRHGHVRPAATCAVAVAVGVGHHW